MMVSSPGELKSSEEVRLEDDPGTDEDPRYAEKMPERGRATEGGDEETVEPDSKRERVFWKKLLFEIDGEGVGVRALTIVLSVGRRGIRDGMVDDGS
jgi:hypothetical protein